MPPAHAASVPGEAAAPRPLYGRLHYLGSEGEFKAGAREALDAGRPVVLLYHEAGCALSSQLRPLVAAQPPRFPRAFFAALEVRKSSAATLSGHGVFSFPVLLAFTANGTAGGEQTRLRYAGERTEGAIGEWLANATGHAPSEAARPVFGLLWGSQRSSEQDLVEAAEALAAFERRAGEALKENAQRQGALMAAAVAFLGARLLALVIRQVRD